MKPGSGPNRSTPSSSGPNKPTVRRPSDAQKPSSAAGRLKLVYQPKDGSSKQEFALTDRRLSVGRRRQSDVYLEDLMVSGEHAIISNCVVSDCKSTNGTYVNGKQLKEGEKILLRSGDKVTFGNVECQVLQGEPLSSSKRFPLGSDEAPDSAESSSSASSSAPRPKSEAELAEEKMTVTELMDKVSCTWIYTFLVSSLFLHFRSSLESSAMTR